MAKSPPMTPLSVFDRLLDDSPERDTEDAMTANQQFALLREALRRDLETLLNTQHRLYSDSDHIAGLEDSVLAFGTPGFNGMMLATKAQKLRLAKAIRDLVSRFETRLANVKVDVSGTETDEDRRMHLRISGVLSFGGQPHPLVFDTRLDPALRRFDISQTSGR